MRYHIGCDAHKNYSVFEILGERGEKLGPQRVEHTGESFKNYLKTLPPDSEIAVETIGSWYWIVDAMEEAGHKPLLANAGKAKKMRGNLNKTDKLDAEGLALLLKSGTLPSVWLPPKSLRDKRELPRTRMVFSRIRTKLKNRIQATLSKYNLKTDEVSDLFGKKGRKLLDKLILDLPPETMRTTKETLSLLTYVEGQLEELEKRIKEAVKTTEEMKLLTTLPGVGTILSTVIALEIGSVDRFPRPESLANYSGVAPRVTSSGGKTYYGRVRPDVNRYLKWALIEAANVVVLNQNRWAELHTTRLYKRLKERRGHGKSVVAVARHLAEASYWVLKKKEAYREPRATVSSTQR